MTFSKPFPLFTIDDVLARKFTITQLYVDFITKWGQVLLQKGTFFLYYKTDKWYCKVGHLSQNELISMTKWGQVLQSR